MQTGGYSQCPLSFRAELLQLSVGGAGSEPQIQTLGQLQALGATPGSHGQSGGHSQMLKHGKFLDMLLGIQGPPLLLLLLLSRFSCVRLCVIP